MRRCHNAWNAQRGHIKESLKERDEDTAEETVARPVNPERTPSRRRKTRQPDLDR